jgi:hypothetical protein
LFKLNELLWLFMDLLSQFSESFAEGLSAACAVSHLTPYIFLSCCRSFLAFSASFSDRQIMHVARVQRRADAMRKEAEDEVSEF